MTIKLNDIFTKPNIDEFFLLNKEYFENFPNEYIEFIKKSIDKAKFCCDLEYAKATFKCPLCGEEDYRPVSCKSKFCSSCGKEYAEKWANKLYEKLSPHKHRHILFTIPDILWKFFIIKRHALATLTDHINYIFKEWFAKSKVKYFGNIIAIHTFGRDSSFHVHFHVIISLGGFTESYQWKKLEYFEPNFFNNQWKYLVLTTLKELYPESKKVKKAINESYKKNFFINLKGEPLKNDPKSIEYIGRYLMRPAIAEYRITAFDGSNVTFWYIDTKTQNKIEVTINIWEFMKRLILHINPKNFKAIRRYGFYSRNFDPFLKWKLRTLRAKMLFKNKALSWKEKLLIQFGKLKLVCKNCNIEMELWEFRHKKYGVYSYK